MHRNMSDIGNSTLAMRLLGIRGGLVFATTTGTFLRWLKLTRLPAAPFDTLPFWM